MTNSWMQCVSIFSLPLSLYSNTFFVLGMAQGDAKIDKFIELISQLPKANYDTIKLLMNHLDK